MELYRFRVAIPFAAAFLLQCNSSVEDSAFKAQMPESPSAQNWGKFERLSPKLTGIDFVQNIKETFGFNFMDDPYIYNGGGVAVIDADNDGLQDLYFVSRQVSCKFYRNKGAFQFDDITDQAGVACKEGLKTGVSVLDVNGDGWQDLYVCRTGSKVEPQRANLLFVNNGKDPAGKWMGFSEKAQEYGLADLSASQHANFFDYDLDGDLDVYVLNMPVDPQNTYNADFTPSAGRTSNMQTPRKEFESDRLFRNDGGKFIDVSKSAGIWNRAWGLSVTVSDFNDDGYPDIYVGNDFIQPDFLYVNNKNGTFTDKAAQYFRHFSQHTMGVDVADLNNDCLPDVVTLDMLAESWERRKRLQTTMQPQRYGILVSKTYGHQLMRNSVQLNNGNGSFKDVACLSGLDATDWSWAPLVADFDNDGWKDIFISNGIQRDLNDQDYFSYTVDSINKLGGIGPKTFKSYEDFAKLLPTVKVHNYMFRNLNGLEFANVSQDWGFTELKCSNGAVYADLDNDGDLDLACNNVDEPAAIYQNKAEEVNHNQWLQIKCKGSALNPMGIGAKIWVYAGNDVYFQEMTPIRGLFSSVEPIFQVGLGSKTMADRVEIEWSEGKHQVLNNIHGTQRMVLDIANATPGRLSKQITATPTPFNAISESNSGLRFIHKENNFEDFDREKLLPHRLSTLGPALAVADVDGNGMDDVFVGGASGQASTLFLQKSDGKFNLQKQTVFEQHAVSDAVAAVFFDADGDNDFDLFVVNGGNEKIAGDASYSDVLYFNDGKGNFSFKPNAFPFENDSGASATIHDYDHDGDLDLFVGSRLLAGEYPKSGKTRIYRNDGGKFTDVTLQAGAALSSIGMVSDIIFVDLDKNGKAELLACGEWMPVCVFEFQAGKFINTTEKYGLENSSGWWSCIKAADLDGDGDMDLVAGNEGLNTRFKPSAGAPLRMYAKDLITTGKSILSWL